MDLLRLFILAFTVADLGRASSLDHSHQPRHHIVVEQAFANIVLEKLGYPFDQQIIATNHIVQLPSSVVHRLVITHRAVVGMLAAVQVTFDLDQSFDHLHP